MNNQCLKKSAFAFALATGFVIASGLSNQSSVQAQDGRYRQERRVDGGDRGVQGNRRVESQRNNGAGYGQVNPVTGNIDNNANGIDDRYETRDGRVDINQNGVADQDESYNRNDNRIGNGRYGDDGYRNNRNNRNSGNYGYGNYGYNSEEQRGYRDGLARGRQDAQTRRVANPNNSEHFRNGSQDYREGFRRGFMESFRQFSGARNRW